MAIKITQVCDGCGFERYIRHSGDTQTFRWIEFYDGRFHLCPDCVQHSIKDKIRMEIHG